MFLLWLVKDSVAKASADSSQTTFSGTYSSFPVPSESQKLIYFQCFFIIVKKLFKTIRKIIEMITEKQKFSAS